jgi:excisionase family DNA binding protein
MFAMEPSYSVKQVAGILGIAPKTVYQRIWDGLLPAYKDGAKILVKESAISAYRESRPAVAFSKFIEEDESASQPETQSGVVAIIVAKTPRKTVAKKGTAQKKKWWE